MDIAYPDILAKYQVWLSLQAKPLILRGLATQAEFDFEVSELSLTEVLIMESCHWSLSVLWESFPMEEGLSYMQHN